MRTRLLGPIRNHNRQVNRDWQSGSHQSLDAEDIGDIDVSRGVDCGRGVIRGHHTRKLSFVLSTTIESRVDGYFLFSDGSHFDLRSTFLVSSTWSGTEDGRFTECEFEAA